MTSLSRWVCSARSQFSCIFFVWPWTNARPFLEGGSWVYVELPQAQSLGIAAGMACASASLLLSSLPTAKCTWTAWGPLCVTVREAKASLQCRVWVRGEPCSLGMSAGWSMGPGHVGILSDLAGACLSGMLVLQHGPAGSRNSLSWGSCRCWQCPELGSPHPCGLPAPKAD